MRHAIGDRAGLDADRPNLVGARMAQAIDGAVSEPDDRREPATLQRHHPGANAQTSTGVSPDAVRIRVPAT